MAATPSDIARFTNDGALVTSPSTQAGRDAILAGHPGARSGAEQEIEMFFDTAADAQAMLDERLSFLSKINPAHLGIEVEDSLSLGDAIAISPSVPCFRVADEPAGLDVVGRVRAYAHDMETDRFSVEILA